MSCEHCPIQNTNGCALASADISMLEVTQDYFQTNNFECETFKDILTTERQKVEQNTFIKKERQQRTLELDIDLNEFLEKKGLSHLGDVVQAALLHRQKAYNGRSDERQRHAWSKYLRGLGRKNFSSIEHRAELNNVVETLIPHIKSDL